MLEQPLVKLMVSGNALIFIMMHTSKITKQLEKLHSNSLFPNVFLHGDGNRGV
jgi:hypothetical protein